MGKIDNMWLFDVRTRVIRLKRAVGESFELCFTLRIGRMYAFYG